MDWAGGDYEGDEEGPSHPEWLRRARGGEEGSAKMTEEPSSDDLERQGRAIKEKLGLPK